jgi:hypothetical protein
MTLLYDLHTGPKKSNFVKDNITLALTSEFVPLPAYVLSCQRGNKDHPITKTILNFVFINIYTFSEATRLARRGTFPLH